MPRNNSQEPVTSPGSSRPPAKRSCVESQPVNGFVQPQFEGNACQSAARPFDHEPSGPGYLRINEAFFFDLRAWCESRLVAQFDAVNLDLPSWDAERRELSFEGRVVLKYRRPAPNQEAIFAAFEAQGWPRRIPYPLRHDYTVYAVRDMQKKCAAENCPVVINRDGTGTELEWRQRS